VVLATHHTRLWSNSLSSLSPISDAEADLDTTLRGDMGAPDTRYLVFVSAATRELALQQAERVSALLQKEVDAGTLASFESASRYLPSEATQRARQASLPATAELQTRLPVALSELPLRAARLTGFVEDVEKARTQPLLQAADLEQTSMAMAVDALLMQRGTQWSALLPLTAPPGTEIDAARIRAALNAAAVPNTIFVDLKTESNNMYSGYLHEAIVLSLGGLAAIIVLLAFALRSVRRLVPVIVPLAAAVLTVAAGLALAGQQLTLLHLVGLLLVVAVGSNYALFFDGPDDVAKAVAPRTLASMLLANTTTVAGFGLLAFSKVSILKAMGMTVAPGVVLALVYAAIFAKRTHD
jgi:predicted exporter